MNDDLARELLRLEEVAARCGVKVDLVRQFVDLGVIEPAAEEPTLFPAEVTVRVVRAVRVRRQLGVSSRDVALVLDLLERIDVLEARVARLLEG